MTSFHQGIIDSIRALHALHIVLALLFWISQAEKVCPFALQCGHLNEKGVFMGKRALPVPPLQRYFVNCCK